MIESLSLARGSARTDGARKIAANDELSQPEALCALSRRCRSRARWARRVTRYLTPGGSPGM